MISKIFLTGLIIFFVGGGISEIADDCQNNEATNEASIETRSFSSDDVMKAIVYGDEVIPMVELPTIEITGKRNVSDLVRVTVVDGHAYPSILLDEVVITASAQHSI